MKIAEPIQQEKPRIATCPAAQFNASASTSTTPVTKPHDRLTFGMSVNFQSGCCIEKVKTGRPDGCCNHIAHEKFVEHYRTSVQESYKSTGIRPKLDPDVVEVLLGKPVKAVTKPVEVEIVESKWKAALMAPVRFFKWIVAGFWSDLKLLFTGADETK
jgi:hypothetical protein